MLISDQNENEKLRESADVSRNGIKQSQNVLKKKPTHKYSLDLNVKNDDKFRFKPTKQNGETANEATTPLKLT